jgi:hypothetical protein
LWNNFCYPTLRRLMVNKFIKLVTAINTASTGRSKLRRL